MERIGFCIGSVQRLVLPLGNRFIRFIGGHDSPMARLRGVVAPSILL